MKRILLVLQGLLLCLILFLGAAKAAITPGGIVNVASYSLAGLPNSKIAQGSIFAVFGTNLGPASLVPAAGFPLGTALGGTSIAVTVGATTVNCFMIYTVSGQVAAVLPSNTPVGTGQLKLTYNGQTFNETIQVGKSSFGIFTQNAAGVGPAVLQIFEQGYALNALNKPIHPGEYGVLWGTGLGPVPGDESRPLPQAKPAVNVRVVVGGVEVPAGDIFFAGRSDFVGEDLITFKIPAGLSGCYVSVVVVADGIPSNYATIAISPAGVNFCSEPNGLSGDDVQSLLSKDKIRLATIQLSRISSSFSIPIPSVDVLTKSDSASATFFSYVPQGFLSSTSPFQTSTSGACTVFQFSDQSAAESDVSLIPPTPLEAGTPLTLAGPAGNKQMPRVAAGVYAATLASSTTGIPGGPPGDPPYLEPGTYTVSGPGGADVPTFNVTKVLPQLVQWTDRDQINNVTRANGLTVHWTGGVADDQLVQIFGTSFVLLSANKIIGAGFICLAPLPPGQFTVPPEVLLALPPSTMQQGISTGNLQVASFSKPQKVSIPTIDFATFGYLSAESKSVNYQ